MRFLLIFLCLIPLCAMTYKLPYADLSSCMKRVGISNRAIIRDHQMTASSHYSHAHSADKARLNGAGAWCPSLANHKTSWLQVDLVVAHFICKFGVQGNPVHDQWVTLYRPSYSMDGKLWKNEEYFASGNKDDRSREKTAKPALPRLAKYVRFSVYRFHGYPCMRVELYGRKVWDLQNSFIIYLSEHQTYIRVRPNGEEKWTDMDRIQSVEVDVETAISGVGKKRVHYLSANKDILLDLPPESSSLSPGNEVLMAIHNARYLRGKVTAVLGGDLYEIRRSDNGKTEVMKRAHLRQKGVDPCDMENECPSETDCKNDELNRPARYYCACKLGLIEAIKGYAHSLEGKCVDIDECGNGAAKCPKHSRCINSLGSFECRCSSGYSKSTGGKCVDIDDCALSPSPCSSGFSCHNTPGSYKCQDIDECLSSPCWEGELCVNTHGAFRCEIPPSSQELTQKMNIKTIQLTKTTQPKTLPVITNPTAHVMTQRIVSGSTGHALSYACALLFLAVLHEIM